MPEKTNYFQCKFRSATGYCKMWMMQCVGGEYCEHAAISPKIEDSICIKCSGFDFKKENYVE